VTLYLGKLFSSTVCHLLSFLRKKYDFVFVTRMMSRWKGRFVRVCLFCWILSASGGNGVENYEQPLTSYENEGGGAAAAL